jgi:hypothetical protein
MLDFMFKIVLILTTISCVFDYYLKRFLKSDMDTQLRLNIPNAAPNRAMKIYMVIHAVTIVLVVTTIIIGVIKYL